MPDIVLVHAPEPAFPGGGADIRARALATELGKHFETEMVTVGAGCDVPATPTRRARLRGSLTGIPPRFTQRFDPRAVQTLDRRIADARVVIAETLFALPYVLGRHPQVVLDAHNVESEVVWRLA